MKVVLSIVFLVASAAHAMRTELTSSGRLIQAISTGDHAQVMYELMSEELINKQHQGSYPLHWSVLAMLKRIDCPNQLEHVLKERMAIPSTLLRHGADYTRQQKDSKYTIFHMFAVHLSKNSDNALVQSALDLVLKEICKIWFCKDIAKDTGQKNFIEHMQELAARKDARELSAHDIALERNCKTLFTAERYAVAFNQATAEYAEVFNP